MYKLPQQLKINTTATIAAADQAETEEKVKSKDGKVGKYLVEIKPEKFTKPPTIPKKKTKRFIQEVFNYGTNQAKWKQANEYCLDRGWEFLVLTEKDLGIEQYG